MDSCIRGKCNIENSYHNLLDEINSLSANEGYLEIFYSENKGKHIHSKKDIPNGTNFFQEVPYVSWPIKTSFGELESLIFCENCLKINCPENNNYLSLSILGLEKRICSKSCFKKISGVSFEDYDPNSSSLRSGWGYYINGIKGISTLRNYQRSVDKLGNIPITAEAVSRCIAQIAADIYFYWHELGMKDENLYHAFKLGTKSIENFVAPPATLFPEIDFNSLINCIQSVLFDQIKDSFSDSFIIDSLLSKATIEQLVGQLTLNSQGLNVWGIYQFSGSFKNGNLPDNEHSIGIIKGACVCIIQSCFNHSCDPNCHVYTIDDSTIYVNTNRDIMKGEELTISYIDNTLPLAERINLIQNYHFTCACILCKKEGRSNQTDSGKKRRLE
ncbi:SET domain containing with a cysteine cluster at the C-terminus [Cryptosporidium sp. chipmunk genotype I]|uniref:SET domain containing with a cysteine cluster at the C-terminus n=1 Tax=Cryptosporidium sp. chipmunk genotype I TaxID=1280935 RepID=UPI003519E9D7|nr:SET domain containing with a cysteine cluster at the C-terminus [Cryptosporidium sp. chipmunk genotype I]